MNTNTGIEDKDAIIAKLKADLERKTNALSELYIKKNQWEKRMLRMSDKVTELNNENQALRQKLYVMENPEIVSQKQRKKWREAV